MAQITQHSTVDQIRSLVLQGQTATQIAAAVGLEEGEMLSLSQGGEAIRAGELVETLGQLSAEPTQTVNWGASGTINVPRGHVTAPTLPASTVTFTNKSNRDAIVTFTGGTVTAISVAGTATGRTSGSVVVPQGQTVAATYSVAPSWSWVMI